MEALDLKRMSGRQNKEGEGNTPVSLKTLSELTGFPVNFIKKELVVEDEELSLDELRVRMLGFLDGTLSS